MKTDDEGSVLIVVLWATVGLVSVALLFGHSMAMNYRGSDNDVAGRQASAAIDGAVRFAQTLLMDTDKPGAFPEITSYEAEDLPIGEATVWLLGRSADTYDGSVREYALVDEASKININTATVSMLRWLPGMTDEFAAAIIDWRDENDDVTDNGAESSVYLSKNPGYNCKNAPFESIEELALVHGATRELLYGEDANMNGVLDPNENDGDKTPPNDNSDGRLDPGILEYVTCYSKEPTQTSNGDDRADVATAGANLRTIMETAGFTEDRINEIVGAVGGTALTSVLDLLSRGRFTADEADEIVDYVRNTDVEGLVNINTASEAVLACIPGIGTERASTVVSARLQRTGLERDMTWAIEALGQEGIATAGRFLTGSSYQVMVDAAAVGRHGRGYRREKVVLDRTPSTSTASTSTSSTQPVPRIIYRRNLSPMGWALGSEVRALLAEGKETR